MSCAQCTLVVAGKSQYDAIKNATSLYELHDVLIESWCSWFNHGIIAELRKNFLHTNSDDCVLEEYRKNFNTFCERQCFLPPKLLHPVTESLDTKALAFKIEEDFYKTTLSHVLHVKGSVAKILGCPPHAINVCTVKEGCIEVHCCILLVVDVDHLSEGQVTQLRQLNIISFKIDEEELMPQKVSSKQKMFSKQDHQTSVAYEHRCFLLQLSDTLSKSDSKRIVYLEELPTELEDKLSLIHI